MSSSIIDSGLAAEARQMQSAIGRSIQQRRKALGMSQEEFAHQIGKSADLVSSLERGVTFTSMPTLIRITNTLKCQLIDLFEFTSNSDLAPDLAPDLAEIVQLLRDQSKGVQLAAKQQVMILIGATRDAAQT